MDKGKTTRILSGGAYIGKDGKRHEWSKAYGYKPTKITDDNWMEYGMPADDETNESKNMNNKPIKLTESDLHFLVEEAVKGYLTENGIKEGAFSALWGAGKQAMGRMGQNVRNLGQNIRSTAQAGKNLSMIQKYKTNIENSLNAIKGMDADLQQPIEQIKQQLDLTLQKYQGRLKTAQQRTFSTQNYQQ